MSLTSPLTQSAPSPLPRHASDIEAMTPMERLRLWERRCSKGVAEGEICPKPPTWKMASAPPATASSAQASQDWREALANPLLTHAMAEDLTPLEMEFALGMKNAQWIEQWVRVGWERGGRGGEAQRQSARAMDLCEQLHKALGALHNPWLEQAVSSHEAFGMRLEWRKGIRSLPQGNKAKLGITLGALGLMGVALATQFVGSYFSLALDQASTAMLGVGFLGSLTLAPLSSIRANPWQRSARKLALSIYPWMEKEHLRKAIGWGHGSLDGQVAPPRALPNEPTQSLRLELLDRFAGSAERGPVESHPFFMSYRSALEAQELGASMDAIAPARVSPRASPPRL